MNDINKVLELDVITEQISKYCIFSLGKDIVLSLQPSYNKLIILQELKRSKEALDLIIKYGSLPFKGLNDITDILIKAQKDVILQPQELLLVAQHAYCCEGLINFIDDHKNNYQDLYDLIFSLGYSLMLSKEIERCIGLNYEVVDDASPKLSSLRKQLKVCESQLHTLVERYVQNHANHLSDTISTQRNDRFVVLVKSSDRRMIKGFIHGESASGQTIYMEPESFLNLNNQRLSIINQINDEIIRILFELSQKVKQHVDAYLANLSTLALLDSYNAKALWGKYHDATLASISDRLMIKNARHPLIDSHKVVANTYKIIPPINTLLISGPNTGGKTVSLKTIGLFVVMTYCGIPISCDEADIPLFDNVFVDMGDNQSIVESLSTFSAHLKQLAYICDRASSESLILLDELGGGTDPIEGESLAIAILDHLRQLKAMIVATTHYDRLKLYGQKYDDILLASVQFDVEHLIPTYRYIEGLVGQSNALDIADKFGLNKSIIAKARMIKKQGMSKEDVLIEELEKAIAVNKQKMAELEDEKVITQNLKSEVIAQKDFYEKQKDALMIKAKEEAEKYLMDISDEADQLLKQMHEITLSGQLHEGIAVFKQIEQLIDDDQEEIEVEREFMIDDYVMIKNTNQKGNIESINRKKAIVNANGIKINVPLSELLLTKKETKLKHRTNHRVEHQSQASFELNLIGLRVDEAMPVLEKYIDDCVLMKVPFLRIIHGFGTGALRKAVWSQLKKNRFVDEIRLGSQQEGGSGATIATIKRKK
ncbi:MAG: endonuclease MutS2 [Erysipelotrichaceae bacterium]|nr:endonuclease MutS2 [Erysipelotrichaceae bacterium]